MTLVLMHFDVPLAISSHEIHEMRAALIDARYRAAGIPAIEVVRMFAKHGDLEAFLLKLRTRREPPASMCSPDDASAEVWP